MLDYDRKPFFLVWNPDGNAPRHRHPTHESALGEAKRLSRKQPGSHFYVLEAVSLTRKVDVETVPMCGQCETQIPF